MPTDYSDFKRITLMGRTGYYTINRFVNGNICMKELIWSGSLKTMFAFFFEFMNIFSELENINAF